jgi:2-aminoadipate transaminase
MGQRLLEEYARRGYLDRQIEQARGLYKGRRDALLAALDRHVGDRATWTRPQGGFFAWLELAEGTDAVAVAAQTLQAGVAVVPGPPFFPAGGGERHVRLSYSRVTEDEIEAGIERLASLL